jgi:hypothetical protein
MTDHRTLEAVTPYLPTLTFLLSGSGLPLTLEAPPLIVLFLGV